MLVLLDIYVLIWSCLCYDNGFQSYMFVPSALVLAQNSVFETCQKSVLIILPAKLLGVKDEIVIDECVNERRKPRIKLLK